MFLYKEQRSGEISDNANAEINNVVEVGMENSSNRIRQFRKI